MIKKQLLIITCMTLVSCGPIFQREAIPINANNWKQIIDEKLPLLGHRNWILVVDKAFPQQNAPGMEYIYTNEELLPTLQYVMDKVNASSHIKPVIYRDKELTYITENQVKGVKKFITASEKIFNGQPVQTLLHDSVFLKLAAGSTLFKILVIKTNGIIPYSSVFLQLDCGYWNSDQEAALRNRLK